MSDETRRPTPGLPPLDFTEKHPLPEDYEAAIRAKLEGWYDGHTMASERMRDALSSVLDLHNPSGLIVYGSATCQECYDGGFDHERACWPCATVRAVARGLDL